MKTTINHKCGHAEEYTINDDEDAEAKEYLADLICPSCAAGDFENKRLDNRILCRRIQSRGARK